MSSDQNGPNVRLVCFQNEGLQLGCPASFSGGDPKAPQIQEEEGGGNRSGGPAGIIPFTDVTLVCRDGTRFACHRVILSGASNFFAKLLTEAVVPDQSSSCQRPIVLLTDDVSGEDLGDIIQFIYTGSVAVSKPKLEGFLKSAGTLQIKGIDQNSLPAPPVSPSPKSSPDKNHSAIAASREPSAESAPQTICQEPSEATPTSQPPILGSQALDQKSAPSKTPNQAESRESSLVIQSTVSLSAPNQNVSQEEGVSEGGSSESSTRPQAVLVQDDCGSSVSSEVAAINETSSPRKPTDDGAKQTPAQSVPVLEEVQGINANHWFTMKDVKSQFVVAKPEQVGASAERPGSPKFAFKCHFCASVFERKSVCGHHVVSAHLEPLLEFQCHVCKSESIQFQCNFKTRDDLCEHLFQKHGTKQPEDCWQFLMRFLKGSKDLLLPRSTQSPNPDTQSESERRRRKSSDTTSGPKERKRSRHSSENSPSQTSQSLEQVSEPPQQSFLSEISVDPSTQGAGESSIKSREAVQQPPSASSPPRDAETADTPWGSNLKRIQSWEHRMKLIKNEFLKDLGEVFQCTVCLKRFTKGKNASQGKKIAAIHVLTIHFESNEEFPCPQCPKVCDNRAIMKRHLLKDHNITKLLWQLDGYQRPKSPE